MWKSLWASLRGPQGGAAGTVPSLKVGSLPGKGCPGRCMKQSCGTLFSHAEGRNTERAGVIKPPQCGLAWRMDPKRQTKQNLTNAFPGQVEKVRVCCLETFSTKQHGPKGLSANLWPCRTPPLSTLAGQLSAHIHEKLSKLHSYSSWPVTLDNTRKF